MSRRRRHVRAIATLPVSEVGDETVYRTRDLGMGGMFIEMSSPWDVGSVHQLIIGTGKNTLAVEVQVTSNHAEGIGAAYSDDAPAVRIRVRDFLIELLTGDGEAEEQRIAPRKPTTALIAWNHQGVEYRGTVRNLSMSGARIVADDIPSVDTAVYVYIPFFEMQAEASNALAISDLYGTQARVVRHTEGGFAVAFENPSEKFRDAVIRVSVAAEAFSS